MIERQIGTSSVIAGAAWTVTVALYVIAALLMLSGRWKAAILVAEIACGASPAAAVRHIRCYAATICAKIDEIALERDVARILPRQSERPVRR